MRTRQGQKRTAAFPGAQQRRPTGRPARAPHAARASPASASLSAFARRSRNRPPPSVRWADTSRTTKRSWDAAAIGRSRTSWTLASSPGAIGSSSNRTMRAPASADGMMKSDRKPLTDRLFLGRQNTDAGVDAIGWRVQFGIERHVAASDRVFCYAWPVRLSAQRSPALRRLGRAVLRMKRAHTREQAGWAELDPSRDGPSPTAPFRSPRRRRRTA